MYSRYVYLPSLLSLLFFVLAQSAIAKPLKVFILCGQSNMEGHAQTKTFLAIAKDPKTKELYEDMVDKDGKPVVCDKVWVSYAYGNFSGDPIGTKSGKLTAGYGSQHHIGTGKIGPEFTFGIYMQKMLGEPILLIKTAWGGKSLQVDFRPPSGGKLPESASDKTKQKAGIYYKIMMDHVKKVLADPKKAYPGYDSKEGYELAGFVWFQGFNDLVGNYPRMAAVKGKKASKDYSEYSRLLACFIRDVRKDLKADKLPFVIGVLGVDGKTEEEGMWAFRKAMAAPAKLAEFKDTVTAVYTENYWPAELDKVLAKVKPFKDEQRVKEREFKKQDKTGAELQKLRKEYAKIVQAKIEKALTPDDVFLLEHGISNRGFHYYGSAKFFAQLGKAFAEALLPQK